MTGTKYQRCSRGCGLICDLASVKDHEEHCTGEERLEDCLGLPYVPNIRWHQTNAEETETANLLENLEKSGCVHLFMFCRCHHGGKGHCKDVP